MFNSNAERNFYIFYFPEIVKATVHVNPLEYCRRNFNVKKHIQI